MLQIIKKLISYGMDFEYEHKGSMGEHIKSFEAGIDVSRQNGKIYYSIAAPTEIIEETDDNYLMVANLIEQECIDITSSF